MDKLFILLELQRRIFEAPTREAALHLILNESKRILGHDQAIFFNRDSLLLKAEKVSGNTVFDPQSDFITQRLEAVKASLADLKDPVILYSQDNVHAAIIRLATENEPYIGVLWFEFDHSPHEAEKIILDEMAVVFAQALALWQRRKARNLTSWALSTQRKKIILGVCIAAFLFPVQLNISAPAEIIPRDAHVITAPFDGVLEDLKVDAGATVNQGDLLAVMERDGLRAQAELADQALRVAQSTLLRLQREALRDPVKRQEMVEVQEVVRTKKIERDYALSLEKRSHITADKDGVLIIDDIQNLRGKPVRTGDRLMMIAQPQNFELLIRVPVNTMLPLKVGMSARFFLNVNPLSGYRAKITTIGYQASADSDGLLTYKVTAAIDNPQESMRIGWKGTARIEGAWSILGYAILRRPLITFRNLTGL